MLVRAPPGVSSASPADGAAKQCTTAFDDAALTGSYGRLDGHLAAIVPPTGPRACRGIHSGDFAPMDATAVEASLASADAISIYATPYDPTGAHDVHRHYGGKDGAIFVAGGPVLAFRFATDSF